MDNTCFKGTNGGGTMHYLPDCKSYLGTSNFRFDDFDTSPDSGAGNTIDNKARRDTIVRSMYTADKKYPDSLYSQSGTREGQFSLA